jgi:hypothetical protein
MSLPVLDTIPKEMYLLIGGVLGFVGAMITTLINRRTQLTLARETHQQQYEVETMKAQAQAEQEAQVYLRSKIEEAHQILSKIAMESSEEAWYIRSQKGVAEVEYHTQYEQQQLEVQRLQMLVALYFPTLREETDHLSGLTSQYWGKQKRLIALDDQWAKVDLHQPLGQIVKQEPHVTLGELQELANTITVRVRRAQNQLQGLVCDAIPLWFK